MQVDGAPVGKEGLDEAVARAAVESLTAAPALQASRAPRSCLQRLSRPGIRRHCHTYVRMHICGAAPYAPKCQAPHHRQPLWYSKRGASVMSGRKAFVGRRACQGQQTCTRTFLLHLAPFTATGVGAHERPELNILCWAR